MDAQANVQALSQLLDECCLELFEGFNCNITKTDEPITQSKDDPIAVIDAGSEKLDVTVILQLPISILALSYHTDVDITKVAEEVLEDWIAELSNQLIGKLKNRLLKYELRMTLGLPAAYFGADMTELMPKEKSYIASIFNIDNELLEVIMAIDIIDESLSLSAPTQEDDGPGEGELELF